MMRVSEGGKRAGGVSGECLESTYMGMMRKFCGEEGRRGSRGLFEEEERKSNRCESME